jgi:glycosyltransferase involved in cell wall biosynthesis
MMENAATLQKDKVEISVIIPTMAQAKRAPLLQRAIDSILDQKGVRFEVLIVINGQKYDPELVRKLDNDSRLCVIHLKEANVSAARYEGVCKATGQFFCFLDDDDELLPEALNNRVGIFHQNEQIDVAVTNGYIHINGIDVPAVSQNMAMRIKQDVGASFFEKNWFVSTAPTFRAASVDSEIFNFNLKYFEWTHLFISLLSQKKRFFYSEAHSYRKNEDNPLSVSKSIDYLASYPHFLLDLKKLPLAKELRRLIHGKYMAALHTQSDMERAQGNFRNAWALHLRCLLNGGWAFFPYTRHLLWKP